MWAYLIRRGWAVARPDGPFEYTVLERIVETAWAFKERFPDVHVTCGLSNVSFGLPRRKVLNRVFAMMAIARGLDSLTHISLLFSVAEEWKAGQLLVVSLTGRYWQGMLEKKIGER